MSFIAVTASKGSVAAVLKVFYLVIMLWYSFEYNGKNRYLTVMELGTTAPVTGDKKTFFFYLLLAISQQNLS